MRDFLPPDATRLRHVEAVAKETARLYGFDEVITPLVEFHDLLAAKSGQEIKARMFAFEDMGGRNVALRPEFTASIARLIATTMRNEPKPLKLFSTGTLYRYDEPQFGRYREFWQSNFEIIGSEKPEADVEVLSLTNHLVHAAGLRKYRFKIGHVGILRGLLSDEGIENERQNVIMQLLDAKRWDNALETAKDFGISPGGATALKSIFTAKGRAASAVLSNVKKRLTNYADSVSAAENLQQVIDFLKAGGVEIDMLIEAGFARGLEYYTGMIFEVLVPQMEISLGGGGRYDKLVELFGGEPTPAVGVAHGLDRITLAMDAQGIPSKPSMPLVAVIPISEDATQKAVEIALQLRANGVAVDLEIMGRSLSRALQDADRRKAVYAVILGPRELQEGKVILRDMKSREQRAVDVDELLRELPEKLESLV
jgi:histidyl-tRNA synthetase